MRAFSRAALVCGLLFLYAPVAVLVVFSFDRSPLVAVWSGASTRWYGVLSRDAAVIDAFRLSLLVACLSATIAIVVALPAAIAFDRRRRFPGRSLLAALLAAPLVMPDMLIGIALLLLFTLSETAFGVPAGQGVPTIVVGHATLGAAFASVVIAGRLAVLPGDLEDAAADLGATPARAFLLVTLPLLAPGIAVAWLLAFSLSLDDVVIASFLSGPGSTTLPILLMSRMRLGVSPEINALATLFTGAVACLVLLSTMLLRRRRRDERQGASPLEPHQRLGL